MVEMTASGVQRTQIRLLHSISIDWIQFSGCALGDAIYGGTGGTLKVDSKDWTTINKMSECSGPVAVKKGDDIKIVTTFDTVNHPL
jgi:hypothetical protein